MKNTKLFAEAIADAKSVRNIALANAKKSLEEAFTPRVESMLDKKLAEMEDETNEGKDETNEGEDNSTQNMEEELESILQELGMDDEPIAETEEIEETEEINEMEGEEEFEPEGGEGEEEMEPGLEPEMGGDKGDMEPEAVTDMTVDQLRDVIFSVVQDVMGGGQGEEEGGLEPGLEPEMDAEPEMGGEEEVDLDELLAQLSETEDDVNEGEEVEESKQWYNAKTKGNIKPAKMGKPKAGGSMKETQAPQSQLKVNETEKELKEAIRVIKSLKESLGSTNLLNAKLLYVNKIFKAKTLTEGQKLKVVSAFDKARTKAEAQTIYVSLNETLNAKKSLKEGFRSKLGFASRPTGGTAPTKNGKKVIVENATVKRFQELAGIIKS